MGWLWCEVHETIPDTCPTHSAGNAPSLLQSHSKNPDYNGADDTGIATPCDRVFWSFGVCIISSRPFLFLFAFICYRLLISCPFDEEQFTCILYFQLKWLLLIPDKMQWIVLLLKILNLLTRIMSSWNIILIEVTHTYGAFLIATFFKLYVLEAGYTSLFRKTAWKLLCSVLYEGVLISL